MPRLVPVPAREVIRKLHRLGWEGPVTGEKHAHMVHRQKKRVIPIPMHGNQDIGIGLLRCILRETEVDVEGWMEL